MRPKAAGAIMRAKITDTISDAPATPPVSSALQSIPLPARLPMEASGEGADACDVFSDDVKLKIYLCTGLYILEVGMFVSIRYDAH